MPENQTEVDVDGSIPVQNLYIFSKMLYEKCYRFTEDVNRYIYVWTGISKLEPVHIVKWIQTEWI